MTGCGWNCGGRKKILNLGLPRMASVRFRKVRIGLMATRGKAVCADDAATVQSVRGYPGGCTGVPPVPRPINIGFLALSRCTRRCTNPYHAYQCRVAATSAHRLTPAPRDPSPRPLFLTFTSSQVLQDPWLLGKMYVHKRYTQFSQAHKRYKGRQH
jgi:hypothetical protein